MSVITSFERDYEALTTACGLLDRSERGKLALDGADAKEFLQGQLSNDVASLSAGGGIYATFLNHKGKMQGDVRVLDAGAELLLDTERTALQNLFNMIRHYSIGHQVQLHKRTLERALLSLIGPLADTVLAQAVQGQAIAAAITADSSGGWPAGPLARGPEHAHTLLTLAGTPVRAIRTDLGIDLLFASGQLATVNAAVIDAGATPVAPYAAECIRIESGRPRYGIDLDANVMPQEAGLSERAVSLTKGCYVGQEPVARLHYKGRPNRQLRGLRSDQPLAVGTVLRLDGRDVATVTSACVSPRLGPVALALVRREAPPGTVLSAAAGDQSCTVVELPFS